MKNFNTYILEKLVINRDSKSERDNTEILSAIIDIVKEYFTKQVGKIDDEWTYKIGKNSYILVYLYEGNKDDWQMLADDFWKKYYKYDHNNPSKYDDENLFYDIEVTRYGLNIKVNYRLDLDSPNVNKLFRK